jgi:hypothetical protein
MTEKGFEDCDEKPKLDGQAYGDGHGGRGRRGRRKTLSFILCVIAARAWGCHMDSMHTLEIDDTKEYLRRAHVFAPGEFK